MNHEKILKNALQLDSKIYTLLKANAKKKKPLDQKDFCTLNYKQVSRITRKLRGKWNLALIASGLKRGRVRAGAIEWEVWDLNRLSATHGELTADLMRTHGCYTFQTALKMFNAKTFDDIIKYVNDHNLINEINYVGGPVIVEESLSKNTPNFVKIAVDMKLSLADEDFVILKLSQLAQTMSNLIQTDIEINGKRFRPAMKLINSNKTNADVDGILVRQSDISRPTIKNIQGFKDSTKLITSNGYSQTNSNFRSRAKSYDRVFIKENRIFAFKREIMVDGKLDKVQLVELLPLS